MNPKQAAVLVAGSWGTALASVLADNGYEVWLWTRDDAYAELMNRTRENPKYLPGARLSDGIRATASLEQAVRGSAVVVLAAPSSAMRSVAGQIKPYLDDGTLLIHATKGFEIESLKRMSLVIADELPHCDKRLAVLSGPSHAEEVIRKCPTTVVVASSSMQAAENAQDAFINPYFRVYTNPDVIGVEVGGALKNIIALGAGLSDGLGFGDNARAALMTRGLAEIGRLGIAMGADPLTFAGLAGIGDLVVTCTSKHSRNWRAGYALGQGQTLDQVLAAMGMVVEGVRTTRAAHELAKQSGVEMPITEQLYAVLFEQKPPKQAVEDLMGRGRTHEIEEIAREATAKWLDA